MKKLNFALTMLATGGTAALASGAQAVTLFGTFAGPASFLTGAFSETFTLQSDGGVADAFNGAHYTDFALSDDSMGNTIAVVGDNTTGFKTPGADGFFGTGTDAATVNLGDSFDPALYSAMNGLGVLTAGVYKSDLFGSTVTLSTGAVPEPEAWALLIAGAGMVGGALRASGRRMARTA